MPRAIQDFPLSGIALEQRKLPSRDVWMPHPLDLYRVYVGHSHDAGGGGVDNSRARRATR